MVSALMGLCSGVGKTDNKQEAIKIYVISDGVK